MFDKIYPASTTKLMTALVALENADLSDVVTVSQNADMNSFAADEATCGIQAGDKITLSDLLYGLLLHSGNDNATAIAEYVGGSMDGFAKMMNKEAKKLMATGTHFVNSNGLHNDDHYTTAYDLYLIFNECIKNDDFVSLSKIISENMVSPTKLKPREYLLSHFSAHIMQKRYVKCYHDLCKRIF